MDTYTKVNDGQPQHDGRYLCVVRVTQPCGTAWWIERIVDRHMGEWAVGDGGTVTKWMALPYGGWPQYTDGE